MLGNVYIPGYTRAAMRALYEHVMMTPAEKVDAFIAEVLWVPEGGCIGAEQGAILRVMVNA